MAGRFWERWLEVALGGLALYGVALVAAGPAVAVAYDQLAVGMTDAGITAGAARRYVLFTYGVLGAVLIGWVATMLGIVRGPLRRHEPWAWRTIAVAAGVWYAVDTGFSLAVGYPANAAMNTALLALLAAPLVALRRQHAQR